MTPPSQVPILTYTNGKLVIWFQLFYEYQEFNITDAFFLYEQDMRNHVQIIYSSVQPKSTMLWFVKWKGDELAQASWGRLVRCPTCSTNFWPFCPIPCHFPGFLAPQCGLLQKDIPSTAEKGPCLSHTYHTLQQFQSNLDEVRCQTKIKKITLVLSVHFKIPTIFLRTRADLEGYPLKFFK